MPVSAAPSLPAAAARPAAIPAPSLPPAASTSGPSTTVAGSPTTAADTAADARAPVKTYSDRPADASAPAEAEEGWGASKREHVDPRTGSASAADTQPAERAATGVESLRPIQPIPQPAAEPAAVSPEPTVAPPGPVVFPPQPAGSTRDVPAADTSGRTSSRDVLRAQST
jgi:hypothetical protein